MDDSRTPPLADAAVAILAGGRSERFGSDKALARLDGRTLLETAVAHFAGAAAETLLVVDRPDRYAADPRVHLVVDRFPGCGPLGGIHAALETATRPLVACCTVDAPLLGPALFEPLARALAAGHDAAAYDRDGFLLPFPCLLRRHPCRDAAAGLLGRHVAARSSPDPAARAPRPLDLLHAVRLAVLPAPGDAARDPLADVDTPEDLAAIGRGKEG